jgi:hypothetical protein
MPRVGFEPTISAFEWAKTFHALDRVATVIGPLRYFTDENNSQGNITLWVFYFVAIFSRAHTFLSIRVGHIKR